MRTRKIGIGVVTAAVSVGLLAGANPVQAVTIKGSTTEIKVHITKPKRDADLKIRSSEGSFTVPLIDNGVLVTRISAGSTGQGDSQEECDTRAALANGWLELAGIAHEDGDLETHVGLLNNFAEEIEDALDAGCFIVYKERPSEPPVG